MNAKGAWGRALSAAEKTGSARQSTENAGTTSSGLPEPSPLQALLSQLSLHIANKGSSAGVGRPSASQSGKFNWSQLGEKLKERTEMERVKKEEAKKHKEELKTNAKLKRKQNIILFFRRCRVLFTGNMFYRHKYRIITFLEIGFAPIFALAIFLAFTSGISWRKVYTDKVDSENNKMRFPEMTMEECQAISIQQLGDDFGRFLLVYTPENNFTRDVINTAVESMGIKHQNQFQSKSHAAHGAVPVKDHAELIESCLLHRKSERQPIGITFTYDPEQISNFTKLPNNVTFSISIFNPSVAATSEPHPYVDPPRSKEWRAPYIKSGFIGIQASIENAYIRVVSNQIMTEMLKPMNITVDLSQKASMQNARAMIKTFAKDPSDFPQRKLKMVFFPNFFNQIMRRLVKTVLCTVFVLAYASLSYFIVKQIVQEHESGIRDLLKMHNLPTYVHWIILGCHALLFRTITALLVTATLFIDYGRGAIFEQSNYLVIFIFFWSHLLAHTAFTFFLASTLTNVTFSGLYSVCISFLTYLVPMTLWNAGLILGPPNIFLCIFFPNWAMANGISEIVEFESDGQGVDWENLVDFNPKLLDRLSFSEIVAVQFGSTILYFTLAVLEDLGREKKLSASLKWYHLIERCRSIMHKRKLKASLPNDTETADDHYAKPLIYEELPENHKSIAKVRNLSKMYGTHKLVLDNISMNFGVGEITVILGHTSSGKSTLILCLAGMITPTVGYATINDFNVITETSVARRFIGLCPQELIVFNLLTVNDHLVLGYRLRGLKLQDANRQAGELLNLLRLFDVRNRKPSFLTTNEKRKLVIAMCLVDNPDVIILDEPTLGMDSLARREIWDILKNLKTGGHTIILSTNMMDEAEFLADRIALLAHGKLTCYGTPSYLKTHYDTGYVLRIDPEPDKFSLDNINAIAMKHFGEKLHESTKKPLTDRFDVLLELPKGKVVKFPDVLDDIEGNKENLGIISYDVKQVSLCDIFIKICESVNTENSAPDVYMRRNSVDEWTTDLAQHIPSIPSEENFQPKIWHHYYALFHKRWICTKIKSRMVIWEYVIPMLLILATVWHAYVFIPPLPKTTPMAIRLDDFPQLKVYTRLASEKTDKEFLGWGSAINEVLGDYVEKMMAKDKILKIIKNELKEGRKNPKFTVEKRMIAVELRNNDDTGNFEMIGYFSSGSLHSAALVTNILANALLLRVNQDYNLNDNYQIHVINSPLPNFMDNEIEKPCDVSCVIFATIISFSCGLFLAALMPFPIAERRNGMKQLQLMTGIHPVTYWITEYIFDLVISLILCGVITFIFTLNISEAFEEHGVRISAVLILLLFLCWAGLPWVYYLSTIVPMSISGYGFGIWLHILLGLVPTIILEVFLYSKKGIMIIRWLFHLFPPYTFTLALYTWFHFVSIDKTCHEIPTVISELCSNSNTHMDMFAEQLELQEAYKQMVKYDINLVKCCPRICQPTNSCYTFPDLLTFEGDNMRRSGILGDLIAMGVQGIFYACLLIISEKRIFERLFQSIVFKFMKSQELRRQGPPPKLQPDIKLEKKRISRIMSKGHIPEKTALICQDLTKSYATQMVINNVNIEIGKGECVSLLGGGGSGKTTIMQMLSGEIIPTKGTVYIGNTNLHKHRKQYLSSIGYCPQTNCLFDGFTGIQMLELMGRLKGVPKNLLTIHIEKWLKTLGLEEAGKDKCGTYSPSMKRRLCGAMALIGGNPIILLDEPTTGVDPIARQRFWAVIKHLTMKGHSVIFSSYNVEECIALSTRILVLSEGNVQCVGTPDDLQQRFSKGFSLLIRLRYNALSPLEIVSNSIGRVTELKNSVEKKFKHVTLRDEQDNLLLYFLRDTRLTWADVFRTAEEIKKEYEKILEKYFISQASLDDIFILLTNKYRELDKPRRMEPSGEVTNFEAEQAAVEAATKAMTS